MKPGTESIYRAETDRFLNRFKELYGKEPDPHDRKVLNDYLSRIYPHHTRSVASFRLHRYVVLRWVKKQTGTRFEGAHSIEVTEEFPFRWDEISRVESILERIPKNLCELLIITSFLTGVRMRELIRLRACDFSNQNSRFLIRPHGNQSSRSVPIPEQIRFLILRELGKKRGEEPLFSFDTHSNRYRPVSIRTVQACWTRITEQFGIGSIKLAFLRQMNIVLRLERKESLERIGRELGISDPRILMKYREKQRRLGQPTKIRGNSPQ